MGEEVHDYKTNCFLVSLNSVLHFLVHRPFASLCSGEGFHGSPVLQDFAYTVIYASYRSVQTNPYVSGILLLGSSVA